MTNDKGTIKIPRDDFERHNEHRKTLGLTWAEYMDGVEPDWIDADGFADKVAQRVVEEVNDP